MKCPECSEEIEENILYCPYCGYQMKKVETTEDKDLKIKTLELKISELENKPNHNRNELASLRNEIHFMRSQLNSGTGKNKGNRYCLYCFLFIIFWLFIIPLIIYRPWYW